MHLFYLHGFASSARSTKAGWLAERLRPHGLTLHCPDFNEPDFSTLTVSRMIAQVEHAIAALPAGPVALIGSSLGGFVALHTAVHAITAARDGRPQAGSDRKPIERLVLLAPAFDFGANQMPDLGADGLARWRRTDRLDVFHHGFGEARSVGFALYEDAGRYDSFAASIDLPMLIFQGRRDEAVDPAMVERFAARRPNVRLHVLDDGHQLLDSLDHIWRETARFLQIAHC